MALISPIPVVRQDFKVRAFGVAPHTVLTLGPFSKPPGPGQTQALPRPTSQTPGESPAGQALCPGLSSSLHTWACLASSTPRSSPAHRPGPLTCPQSCCVPGGRSSQQPGLGLGLMRRQPQARRPSAAQRELARRCRPAFAHCWLPCGSSSLPTFLPGGSVWPAVLSGLTAADPSTKSLLARPCVTCPPCWGPLWSPLDLPAYCPALPRRVQTEETHL